MSYKKRKNGREPRETGVGEKNTTEKKAIVKKAFVDQREKIDFDLNISLKYDLTEKQKKIVDAGLDKATRCIFIDGLWGTGKSILSTFISLQLLKDKKIDEIIYIRNPVEASTTGKLGYLKGEVADKMAPYNEVFFSKLRELLKSSDIEKLELDQRISCLPLGFVRGLSWNCKAIIVDEAASMSYDDILLLLTRCGKFTKIFFIGDSLNQNDIGHRSGFLTMFNTFSDDESIANGVVAFTLKDPEDIVRSDFVKFVMKKTGKIPNE